MTTHGSDALRVWAPQARSVELVIGNGRRRLQRGERGWWSDAGPALAHGSDYTFSLDGGEPLADPRTRWQPAGILGPSRVLDHADFAWSDAGWQPPDLATGLLYEAHIGTFSASGTFDGAVEHLDHLVDLGVTHLELMPVADFSGSRGWGYDGVHLGAPHHAYGGPDGLKRLVDACHARGLAVLLDVVFNHVGPAGAVLQRYGPYFTDRHRTPWGPAVNLDGEGSDEVRRFLGDVALQWLADYHCDGLRLDAVHALFDMSALPFLEQLAGEVAALAERLGRRLVLVAESDLNDPRHVRPVREHGYGMHAQWSDDFHHALHAQLTGERAGWYADFGSLADLSAALRKGFVYDGRYSVARGRTHGRPAAGLSGHQLVGYSQTHDQVGNRACGERSAALLDEGGLRIAAALVLTAPFVPMLFMGEEWGAGAPFLYFTDHADPELAAAVREGRRLECAAAGVAGEDAPDPQDVATFRASCLRWDERRAGGHRDLLAFYRQLVQLRRSEPDLLDGRLDRVHVETDEERGTLLMRRGRVTVACNLAHEARTVPIARDAELLLASHPVQAGAGALELPPRSVAVLAGCGAASPLPPESSASLESSASPESSASLESIESPEWPPGSS